MNNQFIKSNPISSAFIAAVVALPLVFAAYFSFEPAVVMSQGPEQEFTITQTVDEEIAFTADPNDVTMDTTLTGLTGGTSNGTTTFSVATNSSTGYSVDIRFEVGGGDRVLVYNDDPSIGFTNISGTQDDLVPPGSNEAALFGYSLVGDNVVATFGDDGSTCDSSTTGTGGACFFMQSTPTSNETIITSSSPTDGSGNENSIVFRAVVGQDPDPGLPAGTYTATATLTANIN